MRTEQKVFNDLIETIVRNSENNIATITDVKLWAKNWQTEMEQELTLTDVNYSRPNYKNKNQLPEDVKYLFNKGVELYQTILNYEQAFMSQEEFIQKMREIEKAYYI